MKANLFISFFMFLFLSCSLQNKTQNTRESALRDQRKSLSSIKCDILILCCHDFDWGTCPIPIGNRYFTIGEGWGYTNNKLTHTILGDGLTEGVLIQEYADESRETQNEYRDPAYSQYAKLKLYRTKSAVYFFNQQYPIARENKDSIFSTLQSKSSNDIKDCYVFVGNVPYQRE